MLFLAVLLGSTLLVQAQQETKAAVSNGPEITFKKLTHDYGTIFTGANGDYEFEFTNTGKEPLILSQPRSSCGCTVPTWPQKPVLPGQKDVIKASYNTAIVGRFQKTITIMSNATVNNAVVLTIKGDVVEKPAEAMPEKTNLMIGSPTPK